jgi:general stress protein 26
MPDTPQAGLSKLHAMVDTIRIGMLTTQDENGDLRSRPMATQKADSGVFWFFTSGDSPKVDEIEDESRVNLSYASPDAHVYVSISGMARTVRDKGKMRELWNEDARRWFPAGLDDPNLALLEIHMTSAEYWDVDMQGMRQLLRQGEEGDKLKEATDHRKIA